jgi:rfaE bifunctional protein nucleotidyltransferase chain/domain
MIYQIFDLGSKIDELKKKGLTVGVCHGCFDILHTGHIKHFNYARTQCDHLFVSITSDEHVNKGPDRPVFHDYERAEILFNLKDISGVVISYSKTAEHMLKTLKPNIFFKGQEYLTLDNKFSENFQSELQLADNLGIKVHFTQEPVDSSTRVVNKIKLAR